MEYRLHGSADDLAEGQTGRGGVGPEGCHQTARELDRKGDLGVLYRDGLSELLSTLQITIGLTLGDRPLASQAFGSLGKGCPRTEKSARLIEPLGFLTIARACHKTYKYVYLCHKSRGFSSPFTLLPVANCALKLEVIFCVQAVLSPLLSNLGLDELDREWERRGHRFVRYADDGNIYVRSVRAGQRVMESVTRFLHEKLKLKVNREKSAVARPQERKFLGFSFTRSREPKRCIAPKAKVRFKRRVRELTWRRRGVSLEEMVRELASYLRGWRSYFRFCQTPWTLIHLDAWIRRRLRSVLWAQWKHVGRRWAELEQRGVGRAWAKKTAPSNLGPWRLSHDPSICQALPNAFFDALGLPRLAAGS